VLVWGTWLAAFAAALFLVLRYGSNVPSWDDWDMVPVLTRMQPVTAEWLWSQHNEHRVPLPRLLFLGLNRLTTVDFRVTMVADVLVMAAIAAAFVWTARRLRGHTSAADAFFPLALLSLGQAANFLWGWQLEFFASAALAGAALLAIAACGTIVGARRAAAIVGACAVLLPLTGANGLGMVPCLALWPLALALLPARWTGEPGLRGDRLLLILGSSALALTAIYFAGWERVPFHPRSTGAYQTLATTAQFLTIGLGPVVRPLWPASGLIVLCFLGATALHLALVWLDVPAERARAGGLLLFLGAMGSLALGLGLGRDGFELRYMTLAVPVWCCAYVTWLTYGASGAGRRVSAGIAVAAALSLWSNTGVGLAYARDLRAHLGAFETDLLAGIPRRELVRRYDPYLHPHQDVPLDYLPMLREAGVGIYGRLRDDPATREVPLELSPSEAAGLTWHDSTAVVARPDAHLDFTLPHERFAAAIRLSYQYTGPRGAFPLVDVRWKRHSEIRYPPGNYKKYSPTGDRAHWKRGTYNRVGDRETTITVALRDTVGQIRIGPGSVPGIFRITRLALLVPAE
jgi:hypothetical protein